MQPIQCWQNASNLFVGPRILYIHGLGILDWGAVLSSTQSPAYEHNQ